MKIASLRNTTPTDINTQKLKKVHKELINVYQNKQTEYLQNPIYKIRDSVLDNLG